jgi:hypothetical protein
MGSLKPASISKKKPTWCAFLSSLLYNSIIDLIVSILICNMHLSQGKSNIPSVVNEISFTKFSIMTTLIFLVVKIRQAFIPDLSLELLNQKKIIGFQILFEK